MKKLLGCGSYRLRNGLLLGAVQISLTIMFWGVVVMAYYCGILCMVYIFFFYIPQLQKLIR